MTPGAQSPQPAPPPNAAVRWWGTLLYVPLLYGLGWLLSRPVFLVAPWMRADQLDLCGAILALLLLLISLPERLKRVWREGRPWERLGLIATPEQCLAALAGGLLTALGLLLVLVLVVLVAGLGHWGGAMKIGTLVNAVALGAGVGFAEELLFRGWLWGELNLQLSARASLGLQASIFALLHPWYNQHGWAAAGLLGGLASLGIALALRRKADRGVLWGSIGLHGGLVGGIFLLNNGLLQLSSDAPAWLLGPGVPHPNPIGGLVGWSTMGVLIWALLEKSRHSQVQSSSPDSQRP